VILDAISIINLNTPHAYAVKFNQPRGAFCTSAPTYVGIVPIAIAASEQRSADSAGDLRDVEEAHYYYLQKHPYSDTCRYLRPECILNEKNEEGLSG
jgi:hypothetical protein